MIEERPCDARGGLETRTMDGEIWDDFPRRTLFRSLENRFLRLATAINVRRQPYTYIQSHRFSPRDANTTFYHPSSPSVAI